MSSERQRAASSDPHAGRQRLGASGWRPRRRAASRRRGRRRRWSGRRPAAPAGRPAGRRAPAGRPRSGSPPPAPAPAAAARARLDLPGQHRPVAHDLLHLDAVVPQPRGQLVPPDVAAGKEHRAATPAASIAARQRLRRAQLADRALVGTCGPAPSTSPSACAVPGPPAQTSVRSRVAARAPLSALGEGPRRPRGGERHRRVSAEVASTAPIHRRPVERRGEGHQRTLLDRHRNRPQRLDQTRKACRRTP